MVGRVFIAALLLLTPLCAKARWPVNFVEEYIDFEIDESHFYINGIYTFGNNSEKGIEQQILFPFAEKTDAIDSIRITNLSTVKNVSFKKQERGVSFAFSLPPKETVELNIFYRQKVGKTNTYIITSAKSWGKPLKRAVYTLKTPEEMKIASFSYPPDSQKQTASNKWLYLWDKENFTPELEFVVVVDE